MHRLPALHRSVGWATLGTFLVSGMYMRSRFPEAYAMNEVVRYLYRANHIYLLFGGLLNLAIGRYFVEAAETWRRRAQMAGSTLLLFAPPVLAWAFLTEPPLASSHRPATLAAVILCAAGMLLHALSRSKDVDP